jgi:hypothetical protein
MEIASGRNQRGFGWARLLTATRPQMQGVTHASV